MLRKQLPDATLTRSIIWACFEVYNTLGDGLLERVQGGGTLGRCTHFNSGAQFHKKSRSLNMKIRKRVESIRSIRPIEESA